MSQGIFQMGSVFLQDSSKRWKSISKDKQLHFFSRNKEKFGMIQNLLFSLFKNKTYFYQNLASASLFIKTLLHQINLPHQQTFSYIQMGLGTTVFLPKKIRIKVAFCSVIDIHLQNTKLTLDFQTHILGVSAYLCIVIRQFGMMKGYMVQVFPTAA